MPITLVSRSIYCWTFRTKGTDLNLGLVATGDRVAQLILERIVTPEVQEVEVRSRTRAPEQP